MLTYPAANKRSLQSISRRHFLCFLPLLSCGRKHGSGFAGYAFVANEIGRSLAAVDLTSFTVVRQIPLEGPPGTLVPHPSKPLVWVLTPQTGAVQEVDAVSFQPKRKTLVGGPAIAMRL